MRQNLVNIAFGLSFLLLNCIIIQPANAQRTKELKSPVALPPPSMSDTTRLANQCILRRQVLMEKMGNGIFICLMDKDNTKDDFNYLTGWNGIQAGFIIDPESNKQFSLFIPPSNPQAIIWNGVQPGINEAKRLGADTSFHIFDLKKHVRNYLKTDKKIYLLNNDKQVRDLLKGLIKTRSDSDKLVFADNIINEMRVIKDDFEIENTRKAIQITANALFNAYKLVKPGKYEYEIAALFEYEYGRNGQENAFESIVGSGKNATALHYDENKCQMKSGDLVLMDVGSKYNGYAADITRTIPVNGKFSKQQLELYNLVLKAQEEGIKVMKPGYKILDFHQKCIEVITHGLYQIGFITDTSKIWQKELFILYQSGHYLGLDVHDVGKYTLNEIGYTVIKPGLRGRDLLPGMLLTIEPGIYINPDMLTYIYDLYSNSVPREELDAYVKKVQPLFQKYANIGIRIEDDILITKDGNEILSVAIPKNPNEIEKVMQKN